MDLEQIIFTIISYSGDARSDCFEALKYAKNGSFSEAEDCIKKANEKLLEAHHVQTDMLQKEALGDRRQVTLLLMHAEDHLMTAILAKELIGEMVQLYKTIYQREGDFANA